MAMGCESVGEKPPLVTPPTTAASPGSARAAAAGPFGGGGPLEGEAAGGALRPPGRSADRPRGAGEVLALEPLLRHREAEVGLDRRDGLVEVVAVERQARLQPQ